jgi:tetratricopeptide (TPR) repeat protein
MAAAVPAADLLGRAALLDRLRASLGRAWAGDSASVLVSGEAGIGKTSLIRAAVAPAVDEGALLGWGTCTDTAGAPGYWPWTQALGGLVRALGVAHARELAGEDVALLASIVPSLGDASYGETSGRARLLLMDAAARFLETVATGRPVVIVVDDLQWGDESSLALFDFVAGTSLGRIALVGAYRQDELSASARQRLGESAGRGEHVHVEGLDAGAVHELVERITGKGCDAAATAAIHRRTGGHPFFVREVALLVGLEGSGGLLPAAVREAIGRRVDRLPDATQAVLEVAAVAGTELRPDVVARPLGISSVDVEVAAQAAVVSGVLVHNGAELVFGHDLLREAILSRVELPRRVALHRDIAGALEDRLTRGGDVAPAELARHLVAAIPVDGAERAVTWSLRAAEADSAALAFKEAAGHLRRLRAAVTNAAVDLDDGALVDVLLAESDALARAGETIDARGLLRLARDLADRVADTERTARVALATAALGAQFAARRDETVRELDHALVMVSGADPVWEARLTAALARELQHSVAEDRPRAGPLSERALALGRQTGDPATLTTCLLARHDVLWTPGSEVERADVAREIATVALAAGNEERHAEGLLLLANALLEQGSSAFEAALESSLAILDRLGQPRHRYTAETRRTCLALLRGRLDGAAELIDTSSALGERIREPDTANVAMSQRLELVRARNQPEELSAFARTAVEHWTGAPVHAHAVAAGFSARAGDLDAARQHVAVVIDLGSWRADRSYLWSVFVRELAHAAIALDDHGLSAQLLEDLLPLAASCGVNGAVVAFSGSHAHTAGLLAASVGEHESSQHLLERAEAIYTRIGAHTWLADVRRELAAASSQVAAPTSGASMHRREAVWYIRFDGQEATVPHSKGLADIARLLATPAGEIHVLDLIEAGDRSGAGGEIVDHQTLQAYRQRLADIDEDADEADRDNDPERRARLNVERQALLDELSRTTSVRGRARQFANHPAERARKAVTGRVRDAIRKLEAVLPELSAHLERNIVTGTYCRYRADDAVSWHVDRSNDRTT